MESNSNPVQPVLRATRAEQLRMQCKMRWSTIRLPPGATRPVSLYHPARGMQRPDREDSCLTNKNGDLMAAARSMDQ